MEQPQERLQLRQVGRGFIVCSLGQGALAGRRLTKAYKDQHNRTYVQIDGKIEPLTEQHSYLAVD